MSSIRVPDTISKLSPDDPYPIVEGSDVGGFTDLQKAVTSNTSKIEKSIDNVNNLEHKGETLVVKVVGDNPPDYGTVQKGNYLTVARAMTKTLTITTPNPTGGMVDGALFTVYNDDPKNSIMVRAGNPKDTINGGSGVNVPRGNFASFVYKLADRDFITLEAGYIPAARLNMVNYVEQTLESKDKLHTTDEIKALIGSGGASHDLNVIVDGKTYSNLDTLTFDDFTANFNPDFPENLTVTANHPTMPPVREGVTVSDGTNDYPESKKLVFSGAEVTVGPDLVGINTMGTFGTLGDATTFSKANKVSFKSPLKAYADPDSNEDVIVEYDAQSQPSEQKPLSFLGYTHGDVFVQPHTSYTDGALSLSDVVIDTGLKVDSDLKVHTLQPIGDKEYLVAFHVGMEGVAPEDGIVRAYLRNADAGDDDDGFVSDINNVFMLTQRHYRKGESLEELEVVGILHIDNPLNFTMNVTTTFPSGDVRLGDRPLGSTGLIVQELDEGSLTSEALQQFELDTGNFVRFTRYALGNNLFNLSWALSHDKSIEDIPADTVKRFADGWHFYAANPLQATVDNGKFKLQDTGSDPMDFSFGKILDAEITNLLLGNSITPRAQVVNTQGAYYLRLVKWTGVADAYTGKIIERIENSTPVYEQGWVEVDKVFISETPQGQALSTVSKEMQVPDEASNLAIIISPSNPQTPDTIEIINITADVTPQRVGYVVRDSRPIKEAFLVSSDEFKHYYYSTPPGYYSHADFRKDQDNPLPIGNHHTGNANVVLDSTVNNIPFPQYGNGALRFLEDGVATLNAKMTFKNPGNSPISFSLHWVKFDANKNEVGIVAGSNATYSIMPTGLPATFKGITFKVPEVTTEVSAGESFGLRCNVETPSATLKLYTVNYAERLTDVMVEFEAFVPSQSDRLFAGLDATQFDDINVGVRTATKHIANASHVTFNLDIPDTLNLSVLEAIKKTPDGSVRPVKSLDWVYNDTTHELTVSFGETVDTGAVTLGVYA